MSVSRPPRGVAVAAAARRVLDAAMMTRRTAVALLATLLPGATLRAATSDAADTVDLATADGRTSRVTVWRGSAPRRGTILFSHGALSAPAKYVALVAPWTAAGFDVWAPLHVDSTDHPDTARFPGLTSWPARLSDMRALAAHVAGDGATRWIAAGHSYGGLVALTLGGAAAVRPAGIAGPLADPHVTAVVAFSPPGLAPGLVETYAGLAVPALIETGTLDLPPGATGGDGWHAHLAAYDAAAPGGDRYALVLDGADHYFGHLICRPERAVAAQTAQLDAAVAVSLDFLRGFGAGAAAARAALNARLTDSRPVQLMRK